MESYKEAASQQAKKITQEEGLSDQKKQPDEITGRMLQSQHKHVHGALESDGQRDHIVKDGMRCMHGCNIYFLLTNFFYFYILLLFCPSNIIVTFYLKVEIKS